MAWFTTDWFSSHHTVRCAHKSGDVINFITVTCKLSSRLKWYKNYKNRLRLAKVVVKNKMSRFFMVQCVCIVYISSTNGSVNHLWHASDIGWVNLFDIPGRWLTRTRVLATSARANILLLLSKISREERKYTASHLGLHNTVVGSPPQQLVICQRRRHTDVIKLSHHLLLQQRRQYTLDDVFTNFLGYWLQTCHCMEYVTDCLSCALQNITDDNVRCSTLWLYALL